MTRIPRVARISAIAAEDQRKRGRRPTRSMSWVARRAAAKYSVPEQAVIKSVWRH